MSIVGKPVKSKKRRLCIHENQFPEKVYLPILAFGGEFLFSRGDFPEWAVFLFVYGLLFWFVLANIKGRGFWPYWIGLGTLMNFAVIAVNDFRMPVWPSFFGSDGESGILEKITEGDYFGYTLVDSSTMLPILGDLIGISCAGRFLGFASIGDLLLLVGVFVLLTRIVNTSENSTRGETN